MPVDKSCPVAFLQEFNFSGAQSESEQIIQNLGASLPTSILLASALLITSLVVAFLGAKLVKPTFFIVGLLSWALAGIWIADAVLENAPSLAPAASCALLGFVPLGLGLLGATLNICLLSFAFALVGFLSGAGAGYVLYVTVLTHMTTGVMLASHDLTYWLAIGLLGLVGMLLMLKFKHALLVLATSLIGTVCAIPACAMLLGHADARFLWILDTSNMSPDHLKSPYVYGQAIGAIVLFLAALTVQCRGHKRRLAQTQAVRQAQVPLIVP